MERESVILTGTNCTYKSTIAGYLEPLLRGSVIYPSSTVLVRNGWDLYQDDPAVLDKGIDAFRKNLLPRIDLKRDEKEPPLQTCMDFGKKLYDAFTAEEIADAHKWFADQLFPEAPFIIYEGIRYFDTVRRLQEETGSRVVFFQCPDDVLVERLVDGGVYASENDASNWVDDANMEYQFERVRSELADEVHDTSGASFGDLKRLALDIARRLD